MLDYEVVIADLTTLHQAASAIDGWHKDDAGTLIRVGEYSLALDVIAYAYLNNHKTMPAELFKIFEKLVAAMNLEGDQELEGVARLIKAQAHSG
jgi:hypothetical protein